MFWSSKFDTTVPLNKCLIYIFDDFKNKFAWKLKWIIVVNTGWLVKNMYKNKTKCLFNKNLNCQIIIVEMSTRGKSPE